KCRENVMPASTEIASAKPERAELRPINWPVTVVVFFAGGVLLWADRSNFSVAAAAWAKDLDWTPSTIGLVLNAFSLGDLVVQPIGGWIADQVGPRRTLAGTMVVAVGAADAAGTDRAVAHRGIPGPAWGVRSALHPGEHRRGVTRDPFHCPARQVRRLHAVG